MNMAQILLVVLAVPVAYLLLFLLMGLEGKLPATGRDGEFAQRAGQGRET